MGLSRYSEEIINMYTEQGLNTVQIAQSFNCSDSSIGRILQRHGITPALHPHRLSLSKNDISQICNLYASGKTTVEIGDIYSITDHTVAKILKSNGISLRPAKRRSNIEHHDFFEHINTPEKAYFLGWMISDGSVVYAKTREGREPIISLEIHSKDRQILEMFADVLGAPRTIIHEFQKRSHCHIRFSSKKMANDLAKYGVVPNKTYKTYLPHLPSTMMPHLLRGIFDGDGTVTIDKHGASHFAYYGTERLCNEIAQYLHNTIGLNLNKVAKSTCFHVWWGGKAQSKLFAEYIYNDCGMYYLQRKQWKFRY